MSNLSNAWLPADFAHPTRVPLASGLHLRPIRATDVDIDLPAVLGSQRSLWARYGQAWGWPPPTMTAGQDYADLARHEQEILRHESFNYALLNADETALYGCVYLDPPDEPGADAHEAEVSWWVVDELVGTPADTELDTVVPRWLAQCWPFSDVGYPFNQVAEAQGEPTGPLESTPTPLPPLDREAAAALWEAYCTAHAEAAVHGMDHVDAFGDSVEVADALIGLVIRGVKRAHARPVVDAAEQALPRIGGHRVACDGTGAPRVVLRSVEVRVGGVDSVDDAFAFDDGEGDRSRAAWLRAHRSDGQRTSAAQGQPWDPEAEVVFERFDVVWPPEAVERGAAFRRSVAARPVEAAS